MSHAVAGDWEAVSGLELDKREGNKLLLGLSPEYGAQQKVSDILEAPLAGVASAWDNRISDPSYGRHVNPLKVFPSGIRAGVARLLRRGSVGAGRNQG